MSFVSARHGTAISLLALAAAAPAIAQDRGVSYTNFGTPGLIEMPSAISANDGEISGTLGFFQGELRNSFTFQITPRLSGTFRYAGVEDFDGPDTGMYFDRSFDLRYRFNDEGEYLPMIAVGLQDFLGTGVYSSEYVVATKTLSDSVRVTAGLGWGRLGTDNGFSNPLGIFSDSMNTRPDGFGAGETGGTPSLDSFFRGDAALFGGVEWAINDTYTLKVEYSSDDQYRDRNGNPLFDRRSPINVGLTYRLSPAFQVGLSYLYGSELAFSGTILVNPNNRPFPSGLDAPPQPVMVRAGNVTAAQSWNGIEPSQVAISEQLQDELRMEGIDLHAVEMTGTTARVRYTNVRYRSEAQALGRTARVLTQELPPSIETLTLEPMQNGIPLSATTLSRTDLERLENSVGGTDAILARARIGEAGHDDGLVTVPSDADPFTWGIAPYAYLILFNGDNPLQFAAGVELSAQYKFSPNLVFGGAIRQPLLTNTADAEVIVDDNVPVVRRNTEVYTEEGSPGIDYLTLAYYGRPASNVYSRVTLGYLERMYGGLSTELLYKPVNANWAVGIEANYVAQRDFDMLLGFQDYEVATGHASFYYAFDNGFLGQIDAGRYLAGDWGATFGIDREFNNGWRVGAYFTLTDMPFEDYGEGSFDKGIRVVIPTDFIFGNPTRSETGTTLQSLTRDGGARLDVDGRLYDVVRDGHRGELTDSWGRFWR
jgi:Exopolysaccharide biosynthesis protein YbjH